MIFLTAQVKTRLRWSENTEKGQLSFFPKCSALIALGVNHDKFLDFALVINSLV